MLREKEKGVEHIVADSLEEVIFAQGYAHAQSRLWQMERGRRFASGRLSEVLGPKGINLDKFSLTLGFKRAAELTWQNTMDKVGTPDDWVSDTDIMNMKAYAAGVNEYLNTVTLLPPEFIALGIKPEPWDPLDSLVAMKIMNFHLSLNWSQDLLRFVLTE